MSEYFNLVRFCEDKNYIKFKEELSVILNKKLNDLLIKESVNILANGAKNKTESIINDSKLKARAAKISRLLDENKSKIKENIKSKKHFTKFADEAIVEKLKDNNNFLIRLNLHLNKAIKENKDANINNLIVEFAINYLTTARV